MNSTYRIQLRPDFGFDDVAAVVPYLAELGISHLYASPYMEAVPGSLHGYDVVDYSALRSEFGGEEGWQRMCVALSDAGMSHIVDIVPNHMAVFTPHNRWWWSVLAEGADSPYAHYFDIDWEAGDGKVVLAVLGEPVDDAIDSGHLARVDNEIVYGDQRFPLADAPVSDDLRHLLDAQHYVLVDAIAGRSRTNYRRFFHVNSLAALNAHHNDVFDAVHEKLFSLLESDAISGVRVDHIDGLRDPAAYLAKLRHRLGPDKSIHVEKILEHEEHLPSTWQVEGTTGYDATLAIGGLFIDPVGVLELDVFYESYVSAPCSWSTAVVAGKRDAVDHGLAPDVARLARVARAAATQHKVEFDDVELVGAIQALAVWFPVYRSYVAPHGGRADAGSIAHIEDALIQAAAAHPEHGRCIHFLGEMLQGHIATDAATEFVVRMQQLTGPVMAKGVEDTALYRYNRLTAQNEVGGEPDSNGTSAGHFHRFCISRQRDWPLTMNALSTHDTKRDEDVRHRIAALTESPNAWTEAVTRWTELLERSGLQLDRDTQYLILQTLVGAYPITQDRLTAYITKAVREAKVHTSWDVVNNEFETQVSNYVYALYANATVANNIAAFSESLIEAAQTTSLAATLLKLTMPGVPDTYQGSELWTSSLVDPDNRRPVNFDERRLLFKELRSLDIDGINAGATKGLTKLHVVQTALRARNRWPLAFGGDYQPLLSEGEANGHVVAFVRGGEVATVVPRLVTRLASNGGWRDTSVILPPGEWQNLLTKQQVAGGRVRLSKLTAEFPVALLERVTPGPGG